MLLVAACTSALPKADATYVGAGPAASATLNVPDAPAPSSSTSSASPDDGFIAKIEDAGISVANPEAMPKLAHAVCSGFEAGFTWEQTVEILAPAGLNEDQAAFFIKTAVDTYCPQQAGAIP